MSRVYHFQPPQVTYASCQLTFRSNKSYDILFFRNHLRNIDLVLKILTLSDRERKYESSGTKTHFGQKLELR